MFIPPASSTARPPAAAPPDLFVPQTTAASPAHPARGTASPVTRHPARGTASPVTRHPARGTASPVTRHPARGTARPVTRHPARGTARPSARGAASPVTRPSARGTASLPSSAGSASASRTARRARRAAGSGRKPWSLPLAAVLVLLGVFATGAGLGRSVDDPLRWATATVTTGGGDETSDRGAAAARTAPRPVSLTVAAVDISASVKPVGDAPDGTIAVPPLSRHEETGWYDRGPVPGEPGPAVIVGHVDTKSGPSVFYKLHQLRVGDTIEVKREDDSVAVFTVESVERFPKDQLPADRVYGHDGPPGLRLITCGGQWVGGSTGYADNVIAFATHTTTRPA